MPRAPSYQLTSKLVADHAGEAILCLSALGLGRRFELRADRPGAHLNERIARPRADLPSGAAHVIAPVEDASPLIMVRISGAIEQRAGFYPERGGDNPCGGGWSDGHDAIADRLCAAFAEGDVLLVIDSPGGAAAEIPANVRRALAAKTAHGRRCTGYAQPMIGSAATWWAMALCDEIYGDVDSQFGSIGARGGHTSIAGALEKEGVVVTYFADPPEKVALAPERVLDDVGAARGMRDVSIAADAFRAACCASPVGIRNGLTPEYLKQLGADMLTGENAVAAGLADGIDSLENVIAYALALAESGTVADQTMGAARADTKERAMPNVRAEEEERAERAGEGDDGPPPSSKPMPGREIPSACDACKVENDKDAKFCKGCGTSMATTPPGEDGDGDPKAASVSAPERMTAPAKVSASASLASILGATGTNDLAIKTAAIGLRHVVDTAIGVTGKTNPGEIVGALLAMPEKMRAADLAVATERKRSKESERVERWDLAKRLNALSLGGWPRDNIFRDEIRGDRRVAVGLAPMVAKMDLDVLRGFVASSEKSAAPASPFAPGRDKADAGAKDHAAREGAKLGAVPALVNGEPTEAQIKAACETPFVLGLFNRPNNTAKLEQLAKQYVIACAKEGVSLGGIQ